MRRRSEPRGRDGDLALFAWGEALRARRQARRRLRRRGLVALAGIAAIAATIAWPPAPRLVWNASASAPIGLYVVHPSAPIRRGDMAVARLGARFRGLAARRSYLPEGVPLVKRALAVEGDTVCALGRHVFVGARYAATRLSTDAAGRPLPAWRGCRRLAPGELFLLMPGARESFDGRYVGVTAASDVIGRASLLWRR